MENSGLSCGFLSGLNGGMLNLESPINRNQQAQLDHSLMSHHQINVMSGLGHDHHLIGQLESQNSGPNSISMNFRKGKAIALTNNDHTSDEDEPSFAEDGNGENGQGLVKKGSPWQRMKWTDNVIRLLISVVACVGDDGSLDGVDGLRRKSGILQKKGKWKTVSKIMISKGCSVSPQQCEDKFNDLNKRYKRLNEILGRDTSCRVVENPALMDSMPHLSSKMKDTVTKILSSKHLFYPEMCAYHNGQKIPNSHELDLQGFSVPLATMDYHGSEDEEHDDDNDSDNNDMDYYNVIPTVADDTERTRKRKSANEEDVSLQPHSSAQEKFEAEMTAFLEDPTKSLAEKREWIKHRMLQLLEQRVSNQEEALDIETRHFKWLRYCCKKNRDFTRLTLENERLKIETERIALLMHEKELELDCKLPPEAHLGPSLGVARLPSRNM